MHRVLLQFFALALIALSAGCLPSPPPSPSSPSARVTGKITHLGQPVGGASLEVYPAESLTLTGAPAAQADTSEQGRFDLKLPPGEYYFLARGRDLFAFYGRNPVQVPPQGLEALNLGMVTARLDEDLPRPPLASGLYGTLRHEGKPVAGALVYLYTDLTSGLKGMGYTLAGPTDDTGYFEAEVPPGTYYVLARKRLSGDRTGPLQSGDFMGYLSANPLRIKTDQVLDASFEVLEVPDKVKTLEGSLFGQTAIRGRILTTDGLPVAGARAVLYEDPNMFNRPLYVSQPTDADGVYLLTFPQGGTYYLAGRNTLGGAPSPGDLYGTYDATADHALVIETGQQLHVIDIHVEEMW